MQKMVFKSGKDDLKDDQLSSSFFNLTVKDIRGKEVDFNKFRDRKVIMVVNVACK